MMLTEWTTPFVEAKEEFLAWLADQDYPAYESLLKKALEIVAENQEFDFGEEPDPERIHVIDDGDYQGTLVFVIGAKGYQPDNYWATSVSYGSCSGCDALQDAWGYGQDHDYEGLYLITLHMLQRVRPLFEEVEPLAAVRRGVESGTIKGSEWLLCGDHEGKLYTSRHLYQMNHTEYCGRYLVIPVSDGGSET